MERDEMKRDRENKASGRECPNAKYHWHQVDGFCKECVVHPETDRQVQDRRKAKGYR